MGELVHEGYSILIFPEGKRTDRGEINPFQPGVGMLHSPCRGLEARIVQPFGVAEYAR